MKFLLIDDDDVTNYINTRIIKNVCAEAQITLALNGLDAIKVLELNAVDGKPSFDVVFVDISMPEMDGWAFIDEVSLPKYEQQQKSFYVMLTSSVFDDDVAKARTKPLIKQFYSKPLDPLRVREIIDAAMGTSAK
jgi:CheY-like chemotaxis protein